MSRKPSIGTRAAVTAAAAAFAVPILAAQAQEAQRFWSGFYAGVNAGVYQGDIDWDASAIVVPLTATIVDASSPASFEPMGARVGFVAGYNFKHRDWVFGAEGSFGQTYDADTIQQGIPGCAINCLGTPGPANDTASVDVDWDAGLRARVGYLVTPDLLLFATVGAAWQRVETSQTCQHTLADPFCVVRAGSPFETHTSATTHTGWSVGAGLEHRISDSLSLRVDYQYADFGDKSVTHVFPDAALPTTYSYDVAPSSHTFTIGLTFHL
jgi:outer membrane immunogenic protein